MFSNQSDYVYEFTCVYMLCYLYQNDELEHHGLFFYTVNPGLETFTSFFFSVEVAEGFSAMLVRLKCCFYEAHE